MNAVTTPRVRVVPLFVLTLLGLVLIVSDRPSDSDVAPHERRARAHEASVSVAGLESIASRLAEERGRAYLALHEMAPIGEPERSDLNASRVDSDAAYEEAVPRLESIVGRGHLAVSRVLAVHRRVVAMRPEVDRSLALPREARDQSLMLHWFLGMSELIEALHHGARYAGLSWTGGDPASQRLIAVQLDASRISEMVRRERAVMGAVIATGNPMTRAQQNNLVVYHNRLDRDWRRLERTATRPHLAPELDADVERVRRAIFEDLVKARSLVLDASEHGASYPFTPWQWFSIATRATDAVDTLHRTASRLVGAAPSAAFLGSSVPASVHAGATDDV